MPAGTWAWRQMIPCAWLLQDIYDESCTFTDEIDTYQKDKFIKGTKALFVGSESQVELVGDVDVLEDGKKLQFRFQETLAFQAQCLGCGGNGEDLRSTLHPSYTLKIKQNCSPVTINIDLYRTIVVITKIH